MHKFVAVCLVLCFCVIVGAQNTYNLYSSFVGLDCQGISAAYVFRRSTNPCGSPTACLNEVGPFYNSSATCLGANVAMPTQTTTQLSLPIPAGEYVTGFVFTDTNCQTADTDSPVSIQRFVTDCLPIPIAGSYQKLSQNATHVITSSYSDSSCSVQILEIALPKGQCASLGLQGMILKVMTASGGSQSAGNIVSLHMAVIFIVLALLSMLM